ncbi:hypothetical protein GXW82_34370 [Streptacidiphilus sp. 4-A2]|nr:hypothetical protein [Streptacidiphilus sp. 4-A2]
MVIAKAGRYVRFGVKVCFSGVGALFGPAAFVVRPTGLARVVNPGGLPHHRQLASAKAS